MPTCLPTTDITWPDEDMSDEAKDLIDKLLILDPEKRPTPAEIKAHPFFSNIDWEQLLAQKMPFVPKLDDEHDTSYFEGNPFRPQVPQGIAH